MLSDTPAAVDQLGREPFAEALAVRLRNLRADDPSKSLLLHVDGSWGSGKTTVLRMMGRHLNAPDEARRRQSRWVVVEFNAWQQQRVRPAWWALLSTLLHTPGLRTLHPARRLYVKGRHQLWRLRQGSVPVALPLLALASLAVYFFVVRRWSQLSQAADWTAAAAAIVTFGTTLWAAGSALGRLFFPRSASTAREFLQAKSDPMDRLARHYHSLLRWIRHPVIFFIDDLDRCDVSYTVELLETVQTLFRDAIPSQNQRRSGLATYVIVAADRRWLRACFEKTYAPFLGSVDEPGARLGYLFLEKVFQLSTSLPRIPEDLRKQYFESLLDQQAIQDSQAEMAELRAEAERALRSDLTPEDLSRRLNSVKDANDPRRQIAYREAAVRRFAEREVVAHSEHTLTGFVKYVRNPRAMKRLVNAYGMQLTLAVLEGDFEQDDKITTTHALACQALLALRWPQLAERLHHNPRLRQQLLSKRRCVACGAGPVARRAGGRRNGEGATYGIVLGANHRRLPNGLSSRTGLSPLVGPVTPVDPVAATRRCRQGHDLLR